MLQALRISNFILIDDCRMEWRPGFNVLTGETGAGKSVVISALNLLLGERGSSEALRDPAREAMVEAEFVLPPEGPLTDAIRSTLDEAGVPFDDDVLIVSRRMTANGRGRACVNNASCLLKVLQDVGAHLVDMHGQHEHQSLLHKAAYLPLIDRYGGHEALLQTCKQNWQAWKDARQALTALEEGDRERKRREDMLRFQYDEISKAELEPGEDEEIENRLRVIQYAEKLNERCKEMIASLIEGGDERAPLLDELDRLEGALGDIQRMDKTVSAVAEMWQSALISLREASREIERYASELEFDPSELDALQQRHYLIKELKSKYGDSIGEVLAYMEQIAAELNQIENFDAERERLSREESQRRAELIAVGLKLHTEREKTAKRVTKAVQAELAALGMKNARFEALTEFRFSDDGLDAGQARPVQFGPGGGDDADFLLTTIPGKPLKPLREVASGGEISRIMLALKCAFGEADPVPLMIFDEIDVGVGGETAEAVAERMRMLAKTKQVICITHLPQIASRAEHNLKVEKSESGGTLRSEVIELTGKDREKELARMLGAQDSAGAQRLAREMLQRK
ncbi:MAG: DNA repair protein RecN [bacterium]|nr:DNA repair protein RecN [bacterium]